MHAWNTQLTKRLAVRAGLWFSAVLLGLPSPVRVGAEDLLDREVDRLYVRAGDVRYRLPELMAQLELRAVLELGRLKEPRSGGRFEPTKDYPYYEPDPPPPEQRVKAFEFPQGTVRGALDSYCTLNPHLEWQVVRGSVWVRRKPAASPVLEKVLVLRIPEYALPKNTQRLHGDTPPLRTHLWHLMTQVNEQLGRYMPVSSEVHLGRHEPGVAERFPTHEPVGGRPPFKRENATVKAILLEAMEPFPTLVTVLTGNDRACCAWLLTWSRMRRRLNLKQLASAYTLRPEPLWGCTNVTMRRDSALRELRRRHHFEPKKVVDALIEQGTVEALVRPMGPGETYPPASQALVGLFQMNDPALSKHAAEAILNLPDPKARYYYVSASIPRPYQPGFDLVLPVWKRLVHDENSSTRSLAEMILAWQKKRPARLESAEEPGDGRP